MGTGAGNPGRRPESGLALSTARSAHNQIEEKDMTAAKYALRNATLVVCDGIAEFTHQRPEIRNAVTAELRQDYAELLDLVEAERGIRALVLTGSGGSFCAGGDLKSLLAMREDPDPSAREPDAMRRIFPGAGIGFRARVRARLVLDGVREDRPGAGHGRAVHAAALGRHEPGEGTDADRPQARRGRGEAAWPGACDSPGGRSGPGGAPLRRTLRARAARGRCADQARRQQCIRVLLRGVAVDRGASPVSRQRRGVLSGCCQWLPARRGPGLRLGSAVQGSVINCIAPPALLHRSRHARPSMNSLKRFRSPSTLRLSTPAASPTASTTPSVS
ncbi:hypothetical protein CBM2633_B90330 [Cupriavidus taiwanensis]|nr:hypothetical protein CBM2633_B90330 [Cupriavidus taiwanensis]